MTVSSATNRASFSGNGSTTVFAYNFKIFDQDDLTVILRSATGVETTQTITTHYTVSGVGTASGGNVTFGSAPASGVTVVILREQPLTQGLDLVANDPFPSASFESSLDKLTFMVQQHDEELGRAIKASKTNVISNADFTVSSTDRANKVFSFDASGNLAVTQELGEFKGNWAASTAYVVRDLIKDTNTNNIFIVNAAHTSSGSQPLTTNANSAKYTLIVDAASAASSATAAASSATASANSATASASSSTASTAAKDASVVAKDASVVAKDASVTAKNSAETALASFTGQYSTGSSDPTSNLNTGDLFYNSSTNLMKVYTGSAWVALTPSSSNQTNINALAASAVIEDMSLLATTAVIEDMALLATSDVISDLNTLATSDIVSDLNKLATDDIVSDLNTLATTDIVSDLNTLATTDIVTDLNLLATSAIVTDLNLLATSSVIADMAALAGSGANPNITSLTASGEIAAATLDISGAIDVAGNSVLASVDVTGVATAATFEPDGDTAAGDNAAIGYTAAEGLILTGQGSTSDITLKNDNDDVVFTVPTGTDSVLFPDDHRAMFGDSSDLQIWHDSSDGHSYISDLGTGNLALTTNGTAIALQKGETENLAVFTVDGAVTLYHNNAAKIATTSTGVDVTGTATTDGLTVAGNAYVGAGNYFTDSTSGYFFAGNGSFTNGVYGVGTNNMAFNVAGSERLRLTSAGNFGIGTSSPATPLDVTKAGGGNFVATFQNTTSATPYGVHIKDAASGANGYPLLQVTNSDGSSPYLLVHSGTGNVGIGTSSPSATLQVEGTTNGLQSVFGLDSSGLKISTFAKTGNDAGVILDAQESSNGTLTFATTGTERLRLTSAGNLGLGTNAPHSAGTNFRILTLNGPKGGGVAFSDDDVNQHMINTTDDASLRFVRGANLDSESMRIDSSGAVTMPSQPAFSAKVTSNINNITVGGSADTTILFGTEIFDQNADYNASTGVFTAPVTGKYQLSMKLRLENVDASSTLYSFYMRTSNRSYNTIFDPDYGGQDMAYLYVNASVLADMDAGDTAFVQYYISGGASQTDINVDSYFQGILVA